MEIIFLLTASRADAVTFLSVLEEKLDTVHNWAHGPPVLTLAKKNAQKKQVSNCINLSPRKANALQRQPSCGC